MQNLHKQHDLFDAIGLPFVFDSDLGAILARAPSEEEGDKGVLVGDGRWAYTFDVESSRARIVPRDPQLAKLTLDAFVEQRAESRRLTQIAVEEWRTNHQKTSCMERSRSTSPASAASPAQSRHASPVASPAAPTKKMGKMPCASRVRGSATIEWC